MKQHNEDTPSPGGRYTQLYLPPFLSITTSQCYHLTCNDVACYNDISSDTHSDITQEEENQNMKFKHVAQTTAPAQKFEYTRFKASELAESGETFCIDRIFKTTHPDDYGNYFWLIRMMKDGMDFNTERWSTKLQVGQSEKRDADMEKWIKDMQEDKAKGGDGILHGCKFEQLDPQNKNRKPFIYLESINTGTCPCGAVSLEDDNFDDDLGDLGDHPF